ncbi:monovalent cation/H+ antiporter complex subunit F [Bowdeniella massiliensis]|uniref:monovalent cation/H+ antiporter complex subunit F n=1 Tax=Bowdeniella massiliensis TaxID=2932264 RepID=UPI0020298E90|nr:monovalent cation/H+ antiporter complex subunit F [Bowdeniella massiliensis]
MISTWLLYISFACVAIATVVVLIRLSRGPSMLDRAISMDVVTAAMIGAVASYSALTSRLDLIPALVALSIVGFIGTTTIARFAVIDDPEEARIMNEQEAAEVERINKLIADEAEPVHDVDTPREEPS